MAWKRIAFTRDGFRETVVSGDTLYIMAPLGRDQVWPVTVCAVPSGSANVNLSTSFVPASLLIPDITNAAWDWHPWAIGTITSASVKKYDSFIDYFVCVKAEVTGGGSSIIQGGC